MPFAGALNNENFIAFNERFIILQSLLQRKKNISDIEKQYWVVSLYTYRGKAFHFSGNSEHKAFLGSPSSNTFLSFILIFVCNCFLNPRGYISKLISMKSLNLGRRNEKLISAPVHTETVLNSIRSQLAGNPTASARCVAKLFYFDGLNWLLTQNFI